MSNFVNTVDVVGDEALTKSIIDRSITEIKDSNTKSIGGYAFQSCSELATVVLSAATSIGSYAFKSCSKLATVDLSAATNISGYAFQQCSELRTVKLPKATKVGYYTFQNCSALQTADFPVATYFDGFAFQRCSNLTALILRAATVAELDNANAFSVTPIASGIGYIYVPRALVDSYKAATNWSTYAAQFRALEDYTVDGTITGELDPNKI